ncbi:TonB-dependent receptor [Massilia arenosa]|uniref:TonB-dependent receptor n=1 Tax=Zemynaea arenosa TaxID=2561931 RepID=A0A4Y9SJF3_9BURK|nr:TonB-dependent receptor [Massilia arenosa]
MEVNGSAASNYDPRRDDTASRIVVGRDEVLKYGDQTVLDVLKRLPGVTVSGSAVRMRGLTGYTQLLLNGERPPAGFSLDTVAPDLIERIEIVRAATAEFSTQAIAGTINVVLKKSVEKASLEFRGGAGFGHDYWSPGGTMTISDKNGRRSWNFTVYAAHSGHDGDTTALETAADPSGRPTLRREYSDHTSSSFDMFNLSGRINWTLAGGNTLTWQNFLNTSRLRDRPFSRSTTTLGLPPVNPNVDSFIDGHTETLRSDLNYVAKLGNSAKLESKIGITAMRNMKRDRELGFDQPSVITQDRREKTRNSEAALTTTGKYARPLVEGHAAAAGWEAGLSRLDTDNWLAELAQPETMQTYRASVSRLALYAQDEWTLTPRFSVYLGGRWEGVRTHSEGSGFAPITTSTSVLSPLMHTLWKIPGSKSDQLRFALTRTYKAPTAFMLTPRRTLAINNSPTTPDSDGNPALKPELATGLDLTFEHYLEANGGLLSANVSRRAISHYIRNTLQRVGDRWVVAPANVGDARTWGIELEAKLPLKTLIANAPAVDLRASLSRHWSSVDAVPGPDNRLDNQSPVSATFGADYRAGQLTAGTSFTFSNGGWARTALNQWRYTSVDRSMDVYALWKFDSHLALRVTLVNALAGDSTPATLFQDDAGTQYRRSVELPLLRGRILVEYKY